MVILTLQIALVGILVETYYFDAIVFINIHVYRETATTMKKTY